MPPNAEAHRSTAACIEASSATSVRMKRTAPPRKPTTSLPAASFRSAMTTLPPLAASIVAVAAPRPEPPPVTRKTWFRICMVSARRRHVAQRHDGQVVLGTPRFPVVGVVRGEHFAERLRGKLGEAELLGEPAREARLERRHRDPTRQCRVQMIARKAAAENRAAAREPRGERLRERRGDLGESHGRRSLRVAVAPEEERKSLAHRTLGARHVREKRGW